MQAVYCLQVSASAWSARVTVKPALETTNAASPGKNNVNNLYSPEKMRVNFAQAPPKVYKKDTKK